MAIVAIEIIGAAITGGLSLVPIIQDIFPMKKDQATTVKVFLGQTFDDLSASLSGNIHGISLWDERGRSIGTTPGTSEILQQGAFTTIDVVANPEVGNIRPSYISITNGGNDAICVAGIVMTFPDESKAAWSGDAGSGCGAQIFPSKTEMVDGEKPPACVWIDGDNSLGLKYQGFGFHIRDFVVTTEQKDAYIGNQGLMCSGPRFHMYEKLRAEDPILIFRPPLEYNEDGTDQDPDRVINAKGVLADQDRNALRKACTDENRCKGFTAKECGAFRPGGGGRTPGICFGRKQARDTTMANNTFDSPDIESLPIPARKKPFEGLVVISAMKGHSAQALCENENSWGPSFVSTLENMYCDMENKALYDVCSEGRSSCCFDLDKNELQPCFRESVRRGGILRRYKNETRTYTKVRRWGMD